MPAQPLPRDLHPAPPQRRHHQAVGYRATDHGGPRGQCWESPDDRALIPQPLKRWSSAGPGNCGGGGGGLAHYSNLCQAGAACPTGWVGKEGVGIRGLGDPRDRQGDVRVPTHPCTSGQTEAQASFPFSLSHQHALCMPGPCWQTQAGAQGCTLSW